MKFLLSLQLQNNKLGSINTANAVKVVTILN